MDTTDRSRNNLSPQLQRSPSPSASPGASNHQDQQPSTTYVASSTPSTTAINNPTQISSSGTSSGASIAGKAVDVQVSSSSSSFSVPLPVNADAEGSVSFGSGSALSGSGSSGSSNPATMELLPWKSKENLVLQPAHLSPEMPIVLEVHPHEQSITNYYQLFLNIRKQIDKRRRGLFPVQPKLPVGFDDYLMNRCTYVLAKNTSTLTITVPPSLPLQMRDIFTEQEKERYRLRMQHVVEKEKLVLSVEQEILRVHGRAARALANQALAFSVCTILRDEEVYNVIAPEQEEKDRNVRSRYNRRLFFSWLQEVDNKWEKIKEHMLRRHRNEAQSLHAVQRMDWEGKMKELALCEFRATPKIDDLHVPIVHVSDDFDLPPA